MNHLRRRLAARSWVRSWRGP